MQLLVPVCLDRLPLAAWHLIPAAPEPGKPAVLLHQGIEATSFSEGGASVAGTALTDSPGSLGTALTAAAVDMGAMKQYANSSSISAGGVRRALQVRLDGGGVGGHAWADAELQRQMWQRLRR